MIATYNFTIDAVGEPDALTIDQPAKKVTIREAAGAATGAFNVRSPFKTSPARRYLAGEHCILEQTTFSPGPIAWFEAVSGTLDLEAISE